MAMQPFSFKRHRFRPGVIRLAVWLYFRFTLRFRDVEKMPVQRGNEGSYDTTREICCSDRHRRGRMCANNRAVNSHQTIRRRELNRQKFKSKVQFKGSSPPTPPTTTLSTRNGT
jgi:transposase-like protein